MGLLDKLKFNLYDEVTAVTSLIERWQPKDCINEKAYEKSLVNHLRSELPDIDVMPEYAVGRTKSDMVIGKKVIVEMKHNLKTTAQCQRLLGQLADYVSWEGKIVVLLIGDTDPNLRHRIREFAAAENDKLDHLLSGPKIVAWDK